MPFINYDDHVLYKIKWCCKEDHLKER